MMRRSGAPSSLPAQKRTRFQTPFVALSSHSSPSQHRPEERTVSLETASARSKLQDALRKIRKVPVSDVTALPLSSLGPANPTSVTSHDCQTHSANSRPFSGGALLVRKEENASSRNLCVKEEHVSCAGSHGVEEMKTQQCYSVMWCKRSNRKHKIWEGDAILVVQGRTVALRDMDGKNVGNAMGYRRSELKDLAEGSTLVVGSKEVEIMGEVKDEDYKSGKCFTGTGVDTSDTVPVSRPTSKPFKSQVVLRPQHTVQVSSSPAVVSPLFDPHLPGALVMPRPGQKHQLDCNPRGNVVVDVVVDPHLSNHLRPHQRVGVVYLYQCLMGMKDFAGQGAILADEMGLGKTLQCITLIWTLIKQGPYALRPLAKKVLIVTPGSLVKNWEQEFKKWLGTERIKVFPVSGENRAEEFVKSPLYPVMIISYEMFLRSQEVLTKVNFDLVICDEGHRLKNTGTKTAMVIASLPTRRRIILTGTPIQNDLQEFYSLVDLCNPGLLGSRAAFQRVYEAPILLARQPGATEDEKEMGGARAEELKRLTSLFCLRRTQDVINQYLPPKVENIVFCRMSHLQLALYKHLLGSRLFRSCLRSKPSLSSSSRHQWPPHLVCIGALKKLCNTPAQIYAAAKTKEREDYGEEIPEGEALYANILQLFPADYDPKAVGIADSGKLTVLSEMLRQLLSSTGEKVVLVSNYTKMLDVLEQLCSSHGYGMLRLDGSTPSNKRQEIVDRFNSKHSKECVFLLSTKAGGVGLNLIGASHLILYDIDWNPANDLQAMARVWRDGQKKDVHIYRLLTTGSIEEKILQRQVTKQGLNTVMEFQSGSTSEPGSGLTGSRSHCHTGRKKWEISFSQEELRNLFSLREDTLCDTHDLIGCRCGLERKVDGGGGEENVGVHESRGTSKQSRVCGVDQLLQWAHYSHPLELATLDDSLLTGRASSNITFVFQNS